MPIKPENKKRYPIPSVWKAIRASILKRAGNKCEVCGVENYAIGWRDKAGKFHDGESISMQDETDFIDADMPPVIKIVLTIAHINHIPEDNRPENLKALCQLHHFAHDREDNIYKRRLSRRLNTPQLELVL